MDNTNDNTNIINNEDNEGMDIDFKKQESKNLATLPCPTPYLQWSTIVNVTSNTIEVTWFVSHADDQYFRVSLDLSGTGPWISAYYARIQTVIGNNQSQYTRTLTNLTPSTWYLIRVSAYNSSGGFFCSQSGPIYINMIVQTWGPCSTLLLSYIHCRYTPMTVNGPDDQIIFWTLSGQNTFSTINNIITYTNNTTNIGKQVTVNTNQETTASYTIPPANLTAGTYTVQILATYQLQRTECSFQSQNVTVTATDLFTMVNACVNVSNLVISLNKSAIDYGETPVRLTYTVANTSSTPLMYKYQFDNTLTANWQTISLNSTVTSGTYDIPTSGLSSGNHTLNVIQYNCTYNGEVRQQINLLVNPQCIVLSNPSNIRINNNTNFALITNTTYSLSWTQPSTGSTPITYIIKSNGSQLGTSTSTTYNLSFANQGSYNIVIYQTNSCTTESNNKSVTQTITVCTILTSPTNIRINNNTIFALTTSTNYTLSWSQPSIGTTPITYIIESNNVQLGTSTSTSYNLNYNSQGSYNITIYQTNTCTTKSDNKSISQTMTVTLLCTQTNYPSSIQINNGNTFSLNTNTNYTLSWAQPSLGSTPIAYIIDKDNVQIGTATSLGYTLNFNNSGSYNITVYQTNSCTTKNNNRSVMQTMTICQILTNPTSILINNGANFSISTNITYSLSWTQPSAGTTPITYIIKSNGSQLGTSTSTTYNLSFANQGSYNIVVYQTNSCTIENDNKSVTQTITVCAILTNPTNIRINNGTNFTLNTNTNYSLSWTQPSVGSALITYIIKNGNTQLGTTTSLTYNLNFTNQGSYLITVYQTNSCTVENDNKNVSQTITACAILGNPSNIRINNNTNFALITNTSYSLSWTQPSTGSTPITYIIKNNGSQLGTSTSTTYNLSFTNQGSYSIVIYQTNSCTIENDNKSVTQTITACAILTNPTNIRINNGTIFALTTSTQYSLSWAQPTIGDVPITYIIDQNYTQLGTTTSTSYNLNYNSQGSYNITIYQTNTCTTKSDNKSISQTMTVTLLCTQISNNPTNIRINNNTNYNLITNTSYSLSWAQPSTGSTPITYIIESNNVQLGTSTSTTYSLTFNNQGSYNITVYQINTCTAINDNRSVSQSLSQCAILSNPTNIRINNDTNFSLTTNTNYSLTWTQPSAGSTPITYIIESNNVQIGTSNTASYNLNLDTSGTFSITIYQTNSCTTINDNRSISQNISFCTPLNAPTNIKINNNTVFALITNTNYTLSWTQPSVGSPSITYIIKKNTVQITTTTSTTYNINFATQGSYDISIYQTNPCTLESANMYVLQNITQCTALNNPTNILINNGTNYILNTNTTYALSWTQPSIGSTPITYIIKKGTETLATTTSTTYNVNFTTQESFTLSIYQTNSCSAESDSANVSQTITQCTPLNNPSNILINNGTNYILNTNTMYALSWTQPSIGSTPITYIIKKGTETLATTTLTTYNLTLTNQGTFTIYIYQTNSCSTESNNKLVSQDITQCTVLSNPSNIKIDNTTNFSLNTNTNYTLSWVQPSIGTTPISYIIKKGTDILTTTTAITYILNINTQGSFNITIYQTNTCTLESDNKSVQQSMSFSQPCIQITTFPSQIRINNTNNYTIGTDTNYTLSWTQVTNGSTPILYKIKKDSSSVTETSNTEVLLSSGTSQATYNITIIQTNSCTPETSDKSITQLITVTFPNCNTPTIVNLTTSNISTTEQTANFNLTNTSEYYVKYQEASETITTNSLLIYGNNQQSYTMRNLLIGKTYTWFIEQYNKNLTVCNTTTANSLPQTFTTGLNNCPTPTITNILAINITKSSQTITFDLTNFTRYRIFWKEETQNLYSDSGYQSSDNINSISYELNNLLENKKYFWYINQDYINSTCNTQSASTFNDLKTFTTDPLDDCDSPTINLITITVITSNGQTITFSLTNTTSYVVGYKIKTQLTDYIYSSPIIGNGAQTYNFMNLSSNTTYKFKIKQTNQTSGCETTTIETPDTYEFTTLPEVNNCDLPEFQNLITTYNTTTSFKVNYSMKKQTDYAILIRRTVDQVDFVDQFHENITYSEIFEDKFNILTGLLPQTNYEWKIEQNNASIGCNISNASSTVTTTDTEDCTVITSKPTISFPTAESTVYQNEETEIVWNPPLNLLNILYNLYIDGGTHVNTTDISDVKYIYTFLSAKDYTIQVGQFNSCTTESTITQSNIVTITVTNRPPVIINCPVPVIVSMNSSNPTQTTFDISYAISDSTTHIIRYKKVSESNNYWVTFTDNTINNGNHNYTFTHLAPATEYQWKILQTNASDGCNPTNTETVDSEYTRQTTLPCTIIEGTPVIIKPTEDEIIMQNQSYNIIWNQPLEGSDLQYNLYIDNNKVNLISSILVTNYIYIFTEVRLYRLKVSQSNECSEETFSQEVIVDHIIPDDTNTTIIQLFNRYGTIPGEESITAVLPFLSQDVAPINSTLNYPLDVPYIGNIITSYERWIRIQLHNLKEGKKIKNFKLFQETHNPSIGCNIYYKPWIIYSQPKRYSTLDWQSMNHFNLIQTNYIDTNLMINGSLEGELTAENQYTDYGVFVLEISHNQIECRDFYLYVSFDELDNV